MIQLITNKDNLKENDITDYVIRVKALIINSKNEILLALSHGDYQFPGGKIEENEDLLQALNREVEEETGIKLNLKRKKYFAVSIGYWRDHPRVGVNRKTIVYYFKVKTDKKPDLSKTSYTKGEIDGNFTLEYVPCDRVVSVLEKNRQDTGDKFGIGKEMIRLFKEITK